MTEAKRLALPDPEATGALGEALAAACEPPCVIYLEGELGTGKTTLARAFLRGLGHEGPVKSPTYSLLECYDVPAVRVFHLDLYRLAAPEEAAWLGLEELEAAAAVVLVEWPERGGDWLPVPDLRVRLAHADCGRRAELAATSERGARVLEKLALDSVTH